MNYDLGNTREYTEKHHILPVATFPELKNEEWNIVEMTYTDHGLSHLWLFKSINIRKYQRPLNWMLSYDKNKTEISNAAKNGWVNLKNSEKKYKKWLSRRSAYMKGLSSEEQRRRAMLFWDNITDDEYDDFCQKIRDYWTPERRIEKSNNMKEYYTNPLNVAKKSEETQKRWDSMDRNEREDFRNKMSVVNKNEEKRKKAGTKIKELWKDEEFLKKMKNRKTRSGIKIRLILPNGDEEIFNTISEIFKKYNISPYLVRKYRDTGNGILDKHLTEDNKILINSKIETIK